MSTEIFSNTATIAGINSSANAASSNSPNAGKAKQVGKEEFLTMLVAQLKAQDPLDPMKNEDFAVNLAQFSQLEQLMDINNKLGAESSSPDVSSLASYLGHEVLLDVSSTVVKNGDGGEISFELAGDAAAVSVALIDSEGNEVDSVELGAMESGSQAVTLNELKAPNGEYQVRVTATNADGTVYEPGAYASGVVSGFVPGAEPVLLVGGREVSPGDIREVRMIP